MDKGVASLTGDKPMTAEREQLFKGFSQKEREDFLTIGQERGYTPGDRVIEDEAISSSLFIILKGAASVLKGNIQVGTLQQGDVFGEAAFFQKLRRIATIQATTPMWVLEFRRADLFDYFKKREERLLKLFVFNIIIILLGKLSRANERMIFLEEQLHERVLSGNWEGNHTCEGLPSAPR